MKTLCSAKASRILFLAVLLALFLSVLGVKDEASSMAIALEYVSHVFSPDGSLLASVSNKGHRIKLYNVATGKIRELSGGAPLAFFSDGKTMVSLSRDGRSQDGVYLTSLGLLDVETGNVIRKRDVPYVKGEPPLSFALSRDGQVLAMETQTGVRLLDVVTGTERSKVDGENEKRISAMALSADGRILFTRREDGALLIWDATTAKELRPLEGQAAAVLNALFSPDSQTLAIVEENSKAVRLWSVETGKEFQKLEGDGPVAAIAFSPDGAILASSSVNIVFWEIASGRKIGGIGGKDNGPLAISPDGRLLAVGRGQPQLMLWTLNTWAELDRDFQSFDRALRLNPNDETALYQRGLTYLNKKMWGMAIQDFDKVLRLNPKHAAALYARGKAYMPWDTNCAIPDFNEAIRLNSSNGSAYLSRGEIFLDKRWYDRALQDFDVVLQLDPDNPKAFEGRRLSLAGKRMMEQQALEAHEAGKPRRGFKAAPEAPCEIKTQEK